MKFQRRLQTHVRADLVPMIDVVFQLVVFFMVSTTFIVTPGIGLTFPASSTSEPVAMTRMIVTVADREEVYLNMERYDLAGLSERLAELKKEESEAGAEVKKTVILEADKEATYSLMIEVLDVLRKNGYSGVNLRTRRIPGE